MRENDDACELRRQLRAAEPGSQQFRRLQQSLHRWQQWRRGTRLRPVFGRRTSGRGGGGRLCSCGLPAGPEWRSAGHGASGHVAQLRRQRVLGGSGGSGGGCGSCGRLCTQLRYEHVAAASALQRLAAHALQLRLALATSLGLARAAASASQLRRHDVHEYGHERQRHASCNSRRRRVALRVEFFEGSMYPLLSVDDPQTFSGWVHSKVLSRQHVGLLTDHLTARCNRALRHVSSIGLMAVSRHFKKLSDTSSLP